MDKVVYAVCVPMPGQADSYELCRAVNPAAAAAVVEALLRCWTTSKGSIEVRAVVALPGEGE